MARPIIGGPDHNSPQVPRARSGGVMSAKPLPYSLPQGPTNQMRRAPGLGGDNLGNCGTQGMHGIGGSESGHPGIGGTNHGTRGSQR